MSADYSAEHASAYADVLAAGALVTFTLAGQGGYNEATDVTTPGADVVVTGAAMEKKGSLDTYDKLSLVAANARTLLFIGTNYGDLPPLNATVPWGAASYAVKNVAPFGPSGTAIGATVVVSL